MGGIACRVYFVTSADLTKVKIGKTIDMSRRFDDLVRSNAEIVLLAAWTYGYGRLEIALHERFAQQRLHGEWFAVNKELAELILDVQATGEHWSALRYPTQLLADGIEYHDGRPRNAHPAKVWQARVLCRGKSRRTTERAIRARSASESGCRG